MNRRLRTGVAAALLCAAALPAMSQDKGQYAPKLDCKTWLNADNFDWKQLEGRVVLLERWSTG